MSKEVNQVQRALREASGADTSDIRRAQKQLSEFGTRVLTNFQAGRTLEVSSTSPGIKVIEAVLPMPPFQAANVNSTQTGQADKPPTFSAVLCINGTLTNVELSGTVGDPV